MRRREFLATVGTASASLAVTANASAAVTAPVPQGAAVVAQPRFPQIVWTVFSRHLQWLITQDFAHAKPYDTGVVIGAKAQELGFSAVDLTVRQSGLVDPSRADFRVNLPSMLQGLRSTGARCDQITTNIELPDATIGSFNGHAVLPEELLQVAHDAGIRCYRWGGFNYRLQAATASQSSQPFGAQVTAQLDAFAVRAEKLAVLNRKYALTALYHTYSGGNGTRSVWDLVHLLERFDAQQMAISFDIGHMVREGTLSAWRTNLRYAMPYVGGVVLKDGLVVRNADGTVGGSFPAAGSGMVQWQEFFQLLLEGGYRGAAQVQYEYDLVGVKGMPVTLNTTFWADHAQFASGNLTAEFMATELRKDLQFYKVQAKAAGWSSDQLI